ncbi:Oxysterol-binding protein- protein 1A [Datura stramonium]|uniref:Oxysterol-binding protein- protein 1A n=1 Tax=Datura stramonium TaxID=4076 RepID=A0ABS8UQF8_DATST|nr:Oxysterol-binding protein- protein 1A [Datura stramonium]
MIKRQYWEGSRKSASLSTSAKTPFFLLQKSFEDLEYSYLLDRASEWGRRDDSLMRILNVAAFAVSAYASTEGRICKPFNPLLGETYEAEYPDKGLIFLRKGKSSSHDNSMPL